jgi:serine/threonine protein phosphatase PrpC
VAKLLRLDVAQLTDVGRKREHNEDNMAYVIPKDQTAMMQKGALFIVADGMGGHAAGEVASEIAVDTVSNAYYQDDNDDVRAALLHAIRRANGAIHQRAAENMSRSGMGTTCVAAVLRGNVAYIANVGDSRAYIIRKSQIRQISQDHSWVAEQVRAGLLTEEQARIHAQRNVITRSLGTQPEVEIDIFSEVLEEGDILVLCSDGLSGLVNDDDLMRTVEQFVPQESVYHLVEHANENGGPDNITAIVARVQELGIDPPDMRQPVPVGGSEVSKEETAKIFISAGSATTTMAPRNGGNSVPSSSFTYSSGPLDVSETVTAPQPRLRAQKQRGRRFYPTLVLVLLFLVTILGTGAYYLILVNTTQTIAQKLNNAEQLLSQARGELTTNPLVALQRLASAQEQLQSLKNYSLDASAHSRLTSLQNELVSETKTAITSYDTQAKITPAPCTGVPPTITTSTQAQELALLQGNNSARLYYARGQDGKIYQLSSSSNQYTMTTPFPKSGNTQTISLIGTNIPSGGGRLFALSAQENNNAPSGYEIDLLTPGPQGELSNAKSQGIDTSLIPHGSVPTLITAWESGTQSDVYVALTSKANSNTVTILSYSVDDKNNFSPAKPSPPIPVQDSVSGIAAFSDQLFLLLSDGEVLSSPIHPDLTLSIPLTSVLISSPIPPPLATGAQNFTVNTNVPTTTATPQTGSSALTVPMSSPSNPTTISAGIVGGAENQTQAHLFIGDSTNHRVLDLMVHPTASSGGPGSTTPTPSGGTSSNNVILDLSQQYVSFAYFSPIKNVVADPSGTSIYILSQSASKSENLMTVSTQTQAGQQGCGA